MNIAAGHASLFLVSVIFKRMQCNSDVWKLKNLVFLNTALHVLAPEYSCKFSFMGTVATSRFSKAKIFEKLRP